MDYEIVLCSLIIYLIWPFPQWMEMDVYSAVMSSSVYYIKLKQSYLLFLAGRATNVLVLTTVKLGRSETYQEV